MTEDAALLEKRDELRRQLVAGHYKTPIVVVFEAVLPVSGRLS